MSRERTERAVPGVVRTSRLVAFGRFVALVVLGFGYWYGTRPFGRTVLFLLVLLLGGAWLSFPRGGA